MKTLGILLLVMCICSFVVSAAINPGTDNKDEEEEKNEIVELLDDWQYSAEENLEDSLQALGRTTKGIANSSTKAFGGGAPAGVSSYSMSKMAAPAPRVMAESIGFAVGGAKDTGNFRQNLEQGYLPKYDSITYEGLFYDYYFDTGVGTGSCKELFCPSFARAVTTDLYSGEKNYYLSVGLNSGLTEESFKRKKLNLVVVLDISGSMSSPFNSYYYDKKSSTSEEESAKSKMQLATTSIVAMMKHLHPDDRFGVALFDNQAYLAKPLRLVSATDMEAISKHILEINPRGGTNWQAGYEEGVKLFSSMEDAMADKDVYESRIIFLTDAMPNTGELRKDGLLGMVKDAAEKGIYSTIIGVGVDFNPELVEAVTKTKGANYLSVQSSSEFKKRLADEFDFMVTPLVFDLELQLESKDYTIAGVYGSPEADIATGKIMKINTLFPSAADEEQVKGGVVLIKLKRTGSGNGSVNLNVSYKNRSGKQFTVTDTATFNETPGFDNNGIRKAIALTEYVSLIKNWLIDTNKACNDHVEHPFIMPFFKHGIVNPESRPEIQQLSTWERKSCPLEVSEGYKNFFTLFNKHLEEEIKNIGDTTLEKERKVLGILMGKASIAGDKPTDDWKLK